MNCKTCPLCGANLDFCEKCDCGLGEREMKKLTLFAELLFDEERLERAKAEAERQCIPFCEYANNEFEKALHRTDREHKQGGNGRNNVRNYTGKQTCLQC